MDRTAKLFALFGVVFVTMMTVDHVTSLALCDFPVGWELTADWQATVSNLFSDW